jgi:hypothetical protein
VLRIDFCEVGKDGEGGCQTIGEGFFSSCQKLRMGKLDGKLLEMLGRAIFVYHMLNTWNYYVLLQVKYI